MQIALRSMARNLAQKLPCATKAVLPCSRSFVTANPRLISTDAVLRQLNGIRPFNQTCRTFAATAVSKEPEALLEAIDDEIDHEKTQNPDREV